MVESAMVMYSGRIISMSRGKPASVDFDFDAVWDFKREMGDRFHPESLVWIHVHPGSYGYQPSSQDLICAKALKAAFGTLGSFKIVCFFDDNLDDAEGGIASYRLEEGFLVDAGVERIETEDPYWWMLKALSVVQ